MVNKPSYSYDDFKRACGEDPKTVIPIGDTLKKASADFNLRTPVELKGFIYGGGLENLTFINSKDWENNPDPNHKIKVDAYEFMSLSKLGYIAFMRNENTGKWLIKSFHLSNKRNTEMEQALRKAGILKGD